MAEQGNYVAEDGALTAEVYNHILVVSVGRPLHSSISCASGAGCDETIEYEAEFSKRHDTSKASGSRFAEDDWCVPSRCASEKWHSETGDIVSASRASNSRSRRREQHCRPFRVPFLARAARGARTISSANPAT